MNLTIIKTKLIESMAEENVSVSQLSKNTNIDIITLILILYFPFYKISMTRFMSICKALNVIPSDILDIHFDIRRANQI